jgi:hypothetical protein
MGEILSLYVLYRIVGRNRAGCDGSLQQCQGIIEPATVFVTAIGALLLVRRMAARSEAQDGQEAPDFSQRRGRGAS